MGQLVYIRCVRVANTNRDNDVIQAFYSEEDCVLERGTIMWPMQLTEQERWTIILP